MGEQEEGVQGQEGAEDGGAGEGIEEEGGGGRGCWLWRSCRRSPRRAGGLSFLLLSRDFVSSLVTLFVEGKQ